MLNVDVTIAPWAVCARRPRCPTAANRSSSTPRSSPASSGGFASEAASAGLVAISAARAARVDHHVWDRLPQLAEPHPEAGMMPHVFETGRPRHRQPRADRRPPPGAPRRLAAKLRRRREGDQLEL